MTTPLIEMEIERQLAELIAPAVDVPLYCFWGDMATGNKRTVQRSSIAIKANPRSIELFSSDVIQVLVVISLSTSTEDQRTGKNFTELWQVITNTLTGIAGCEGDRTKLDIDGSFTATGVELQEGGDCGYDDTTKAWWATVTLAIDGIISQTTETDTDQTNDNLKISLEETAEGTEGE